MMKKRKYKVNIGNRLADTLMALTFSIIFFAFVKEVELQNEKDKNDAIKLRLERIEKALSVSENSYSKANQLDICKK